MAWGLERLYQSVNSKKFASDFSHLNEYLTGLKNQLEDKLNIEDLSVELIEVFIHDLKEVMKIHEKLQYYCHLSKLIDVNSDLFIQKLSDLGLIEYEIKTIESALSILLLNSNFNYSHFNQSQYKNYIYGLFSNNHKSDQSEIMEYANAAMHDWKTLYDQVIYKEKINNFESNSFAESVVGSCFINIKKNKLIMAKKKGYTSLLEQANSESSIEEDVINSFKASIDEHAEQLKTKIINLNDKNLEPVLKSKINQEEAFQILKDSLSILGTDVTSLIDQWFDNDSILINTNSNYGNFCVPIRPIKEIRVMISSFNTLEDVIGLSHELGHAYHLTKLMELEYLDFSFPLSISELPSTFFAHLTYNYILDKENNDAKKSIIKDKYQKSILDDILQMYSRFEFEHTVLENIDSKSYTGKMLTETMNTILKKFYGDDYKSFGIDVYQWIKKSQFYMLNRDYYNYPYAMGNILSMFLQSELTTKEEDFIQLYDAFLISASYDSFKDTFKKFGIDVSCKEFWNNYLLNILT